MESTTVRLNKESYAKLRQLSKKSGESLQEVLAKAIDHLERKRFLEQANADFARLREDPKAWEEELRERRVWDVTLMDGLKGDIYPMEGLGDDKR
ncbi:MAG: toxin-antitoxin system protein [Chloroflexi bacterium]|nr:toxin-antitoxin system protein [Chloroflexota bacterium]